MKRRSATDGKRIMFRQDELMNSSAACQFSKTIVSAGEEAGREQRDYKRKGNDHENGNGARSVHGPPPISLARKLGESTRHCSLLPSTPLGFLGSLGQQKRRAVVHVLPYAVS